jgi:hypothetical protein
MRGKAPRRSRNDGQPYGGGTDADRPNCVPPPPVIGRAATALEYDGVFGESGCGDSSLYCCLSGTTRSRHPSGCHNTGTNVCIRVTTSAAFGPIMHRPTSPPSNTWPIICCAKLPARPHCAAGARPPHGTTIFPQASSPGEIVHPIPLPLAMNMPRLHSPDRPPAHGI